MPSTFSESKLALELQATGENPGTWGDKANTVFTQIVKMMRKLTKAVGGSSDVTLTASEAEFTYHEYTGTLTGNINVNVVQEEGFYYVHNNTTGAFTLTVKTLAGAGVVVTQGDKTVLFCDGTTVVEVKSVYLSTMNVAGEAVVSGPVSIKSTFVADSVASVSASASQEDWGPSGLSTAFALRVVASTSAYVGGLTGGTRGRALFVHNVGPAPLTLKDESSGSTAANRFALNGDVLLQADESTWGYWDSTSSRWRVVHVRQPVTQGYLFGLTLSNNGSDPTNDMDIAAGFAAHDVAPYQIMSGTAMTKRLDATWSAGTGNGFLDTGSIANTTYHIFLIERPDTGATDYLASTSPTAPTMPTNYTRKRRIGSLIRVGGNIIRTVQLGDVFMYTGGGTLDVDATNPGTSAVTRTLSVPLGIVVEAVLAVTLDGITSSGLNLYLSSLDQDDVAASATNQTIAIAGSTVGVQGAGVVRIKTNTSGQIRSRLGVSGAADQLRMSTLGWIDTRGRVV